MSGEFGRRPLWLVLLAAAAGVAAVLGGCRVHSAPRVAATVVPGQTFISAHGLTAPAAPGEELWIIQRAPRPSDTDAGGREHVSGVLVCGDPSDGGTVSVRPDRFDVRAQIGGILATTRVTQSFRNPLASTVDAVYVLDLPPDASVADFVLTVGPRTIRGVVRDRAEAERFYTEARAAGLTATYFTLDRPGVFVQHLSGVPARGRVGAEVVYDQVLACLDDGRLEYAFPIRRGAPGAPGPVSIDVAIDDPLAADRIDAGPHRVVLDGAPGPIVRARLAADGLAPDADFVLRFRLAAELDRALLVTHRAGSGDGYFALVHIPSRAAQDAGGGSSQVSFDLTGLSPESLFPAALRTGGPVPVRGGRPLVLLGRYRGEPPRRLLVADELGATHVVRAEHVSSPAGAAALARLWAGRRIAELEAGGSADAEAAARRLALAHSLASPWTAFIAVDAAGRVYGE